jgi:DNA-binding transcriptional LysR family regulator
MDRFESISAFVAVARAGGFSAAGRQLGIPLPTISRRVAELEQALGARLLHRTTRRIELTERGRDFFVACQRVLDDLKEAEEAVAGEYRLPRGDLSITAPVGFGRIHLQPVATEFLAAYPEINLKLVLVDRLVSLVEEHVDAALRIADLPDSALVARPLGNIRVIVCASPEYLGRCGAPKHPKALVKHDCIAWSTLLPANSWWFRENDRDLTYPIRVRFATTVTESAVAAAESGLGIVQTTSYQAEAAIRAGRLVRILDKFECAPTAVSLVYPTSRLVPLKLRVFLDFVAPRLARRLKRAGTVVS